jgi:hypothetical protein
VLSHTAVASPAGSTGGACGVTGGGGAGVVAGGGAGVDELVVGLVVVLGGGVELGVLGRDDGVVGAVLDGEDELGREDGVVGRWLLGGSAG